MKAVLNGSNYAFSFCISLCNDANNLLLLQSGNTTLAAAVEFPLSQAECLFSCNSVKSPSLAH